MGEEGFKPFFEDEDLLACVDMMARRYGVLPSDLLNMSIFDFSLNMAVMIKMLGMEKREIGGVKKELTVKDLKGMGISHTIVKKDKG